MRRYLVIIWVVCRSVLVIVMLIEFILYLIISIISMSRLLNKIKIFIIGLALLFPIWIIEIHAQSGSLPFLYGDALPDAPELATRGEFKVGVRTLELINKNQVDILHSRGVQDTLYDRKLKVEIWYPAVLATNVQELVVYDQVMGQFNNPARPIIPFNFQGRAARDAAPDLVAGGYPLIIVSHGYTGSRLIFTYLTENLASKGYVVVSIDHTESTFLDAAVTHSFFTSPPSFFV